MNRTGTSCRCLSGGETGHNTARRPKGREPRWSDLRGIVHVQAGDHDSQEEIKDSRPFRREMNGAEGDRTLNRSIANAAIGLAATIYCVMIYGSEFRSKSLLDSPSIFEDFKTLSTVSLHMQRSGGHRKVEPGE